MDLNKYVNTFENNYYNKSYFGRMSEGVRGERPSVDLDDSRIFSRLLGIVGNESGTRTIIATMFWQIITESYSFKEIIKKKFNVNDPLMYGGRLILSTYPESNKRRYDLVILSRDIDLKSAFSIPLNQIHVDDYTTYYPNLVEQYQYSQKVELHYIMRTGGIELDEYDYKFSILEAIYNWWSIYEFKDFVNQHDFLIFFAPMPKTILTSGGIASPAHGISLQSHLPCISSAGVFTKDNEGRTGVTAALHGVVDEPKSIYGLFNQNGASCVVGKEVFVNGVKGIIRSADLITDSCFIELPVEHDLKSCLSIPCIGPLYTRGPYRGESVTFDGLTSSMTQTVITEVDIGVTKVSRDRQAKVYTKPVTNQGDSGSALYNEGGNVLGFNHSRTGYNEDIEFADWIWADSVYQALNLRK